jgi:predicted esterase
MGLPAQEPVVNLQHSCPIACPLQIMSVSGVPAWQQMSPALVAAGWGPGTEAAAYVPPVLLIHGKQDKSVPASQASEMHQTLLSIGIDSTLR